MTTAVGKYSFTSTRIFLSICLLNNLGQAGFSSKLFIPSILGILFVFYPTMWVLILKCSFGNVWGKTYLGTSVKSCSSFLLEEFLHPDAVQLGSAELIPRMNSEISRSGWGNRKKAGGIRCRWGSLAGGEWLGSAWSLTFRLPFDPLINHFPCFFRGLLKIYTGQFSTIHFLSRS